MDYRLLVDFEVVKILDSSSRPLRARLLGHRARLHSAPNRYVDYQEISPAGCPLEVSVFAGDSFHYWIDAADKPVKVLDIRPADK